MHSSTSSFERHVPGGRWGATWLVVAIAVVSVVVRYELFLRARHYQPSVKDDEYGWAWQRARVADNSTHTVALLGSSRIMLAFSGDAFTAALPGWRFAQLALNGTTPVGSLRDLAADDRFKGVAVVDMTELALYPGSWESQHAEIWTYHRRWRAVGAMAERWLSTYVQSHLALLSTRGVHTFGKWWRTGKWPLPPYVVTHADRTRFADFSLTDLERQRRVRVDQMAGWWKEQGDADTWLGWAMLVEPAVLAIEARGGRVVYVRMPTCGERWTVEEQQHPKALFWDRLAARSHATLIHFRDYPELASFDCPDLSHIASADGPRFTRALIEVMRAKGVLGN